MRAGTSIACLLLLAASPARGQAFLDEFSYDGLRFTGVGVEAGAVFSNSITTEPIGGLRADLGVIAPRVRVVVGGSYFKGSFKPDRIARFEQRLQEALTSCACDSLSIGSITQSNIELFLALQYLFPSLGRVQAYAGAGFSAHIRNGDGAVIKDTFVEDALDTVAAGLDGSVGIEVGVLRGVAVLAELRGVLTSELRSLSARGGLMFRFP